MKRIITITLAAFLITTTINAQGNSANTHSVAKSSWGIGFGIPYGVVGGNVDFNLASNLNASVGIGTTVLSGMGYSIGAKYFLISLNSTFRPKISAYYGTNTIVQTSFGSDGLSFTGLSVGAGAQWMWGESKSNGLDIDVMYVATSGYSGTEEYGKIKLSIGYRHSL